MPTALTPIERLPSQTSVTCCSSFEMGTLRYNLLSNKGKEGEVLGSMTKRLTIVLLAVALAVSGSPLWAADAAAGKAVYTSKCQACHAADGSGNPGLGKALGVTWVPLGSADVQKMSDDDLKKAITAGKGKMKPVASVTGADLDNVIAYVRTLKK